MIQPAVEQERGNAAPSGGGTQPSETEQRGDRPMIESEVMANVQRMTDDALDSMFNIATYLAGCKGGVVPKLPANGNSATNVLPARPTHAIEVDEVVADDFTTFIRETGRNPLYEANAAMVSQLVSDLATADVRRVAFDEWCEGPRDSLTGTEAWEHDPMRERFCRETEGLVLGFGGIMDAFVLAIQPGRWVQVYDTESGATADGYVTQVKADYCMVKLYGDDIDKEDRVEWADISVVADRKVEPSGHPKGNGSGAKPASPDADPAAPTIRIEVGAHVLAGDGEEVYESIIKTVLPQGCIVQPTDHPDRGEFLCPWNGLQLDLENYVASDNTLASVQQPQAEPEPDPEPVDESERPALLAQAIDHLQNTPTDILKSYGPALAEFREGLDPADEPDDGQPVAAASEGGVS